MGKKFVLNADDFGMTKEQNRAVLEGYNNGFLTSTSIVANGEAFSAAVNDILPECPNIGVGVHLNITHGKSLTNSPMLTDNNGNFNGGYLYFLLNSVKKEFLDEVEKEFRAQIEEVEKYADIDHLDSHNHIHAIPDIFKLTLKLAEEYNIPYIRLHKENFYFVKDFIKHLNYKYPFNLIKMLILNWFSEINKEHLKEYKVKTNDYIIGIKYSKMLDAISVEKGLQEIDDENSITEVIITPSYSEKIRNAHTTEFSLSIDKKLEDTINRLGFEITNYKKLTK